MYSGRKNHLFMKVLTLFCRQIRRRITSLLWPALDNEDEYLFARPVLLVSWRGVAVYIVNPAGMIDAVLLCGGRCGVVEQDANSSTATSAPLKKIVF